MDPTQTPPETLIDGPRGWEGRIARGFRLARVSWEVLSGERRLLVLPLLAAICALAALIATATLARRLHGGPEAVRVIAPVWIAAYLISFTTIFFNVALVHVVARRWQGEPARIADGLLAAGRRVGAIAGWSALTTTVGLGLQIVERLTFGISRLVADVAWSVASFFVVPVLVVERRGPVRSLRRSAGIVRSRWVEGLSGATPIAVATLLVLLPVFGLMFIGAVLYVTGLAVPGLMAMTGAATAAMLIWIVSVALTQVFTLAVFQHATGGPCFDGFPAGDLERPRNARSMRVPSRLRRGSS
jgi:hypothetical protein